MTETLIKYPLNAQSVHIYLDFCLAGANELSSVLTSSSFYKSGSFFTLLPKGKQENETHAFRSGGIAHGLQKLVAKALYETMISLGYGSYIFDDVASTYVQNDYEDALFNECGLTYQQEVYYLFSIAEVSVELITRCLRTSRAIWHSLGILTRLTKEQSSAKTWSQEYFEEAVNNLELVVIGAYDGEGYIFWEPDSNATPMPDVIIFK